MAITSKTQAALIGLATLAVTTFGTVTIAKLNTIHTLTNSNLTAVNQRLDDAIADNKMLSAKIESLHTLMVEMRKPIVIPSKP